MFNTPRDSHETLDPPRPVRHFRRLAALGALTGCGHRYDHHGWNGDPSAHAEMRGKMIERISRRLDLNEEQKKRLTVLADRMQEQRAALHGSGGEPREEMRKLVAGDKFDRARAQALVGEKTAAVNTKSPEVIAALGDFYDSLDAKQQA
ncbi:Spy/CpxP family protein refolding chaperone [Ramlibacter sp.]|uniref:Spy/CpxP family protein refolding chaperone n=1 Tax=Ramlibacter sp. TaxID=1917967 RepID=UPI00342D35A0